MKSVFISTVTGKDNPKLMTDLAEKTLSLGGVWKIQKSIRLGGQKASLMRLEIDQDKFDSLKSTLERDFPELTFSYTEEVATEKKGRVITLELDCEDKPGLTRQITAALGDMDVVLEDMEFNRYPVTAADINVYSAKLKVRVPEDVSDTEIADELEGISDRMKVIVI